MKHKQVFAVLLTLTMAACNIPAAVLADDTAGAGSTVHVTSADDFGTLSGGCYILNSDKTYVLDNDITTSGRIVTRNAEVTIDLNGKTIDRGLNDPQEGGGVFGVESGSVLTVAGGEVKGGYRGDGNGGAFNVEGTLILDSVTVAGNRAGHAGGGIYVSGANASVTLEGACRVTGNKAGTNGSGIYVGNGASLKIKDSPRVTDNGSENVYLSSGCRINVTGALGDDAKLGITHEDEGKDAFTTGYGANNANKSADKFFAADNGKEKIATSENEAWIAYGYVSRTWDNEFKRVVETDGEAIRFTSLDTISLSGDQTVDLVSNNWYVVRKDVRLDHVVRCFIGANILLTDGTTLTCNHGIVVEDSNTLNIYGQTEDTGKLTVNGDKYYAGIGGGQRKTVGYINIYGGIIESTGGEYGAGIGGGYEGGTINGITIYGGNVTSTGGARGAGIGTGVPYSESFGTVRIYGGKVSAAGGNNSAGIGGGYEDYAYYDYNMTSGTIEIRGGKVVAEGSGHAAGIGGGHYYNVNIDITISGGDVTAKSEGSSNYNGAAAIGSAAGFKGNITISGGNVKAYGYKYSSGIGSGSNRDTTGTITISGGTVEAIAYDGGAPIGGAGSEHEHGLFPGGITGTVNITGGTVILGRAGEPIAPCSLIGSGSYSEPIGHCGTLNIANGLCMRFDNGSSWVPAEERVSVCQAVSTDTTKLRIGQCAHPETKAVDDGDQHIIRCVYCNTDLRREDHTYVNGVCSQCGHVNHDGIGERLEGYSLSLKGDIGVNFYMSLAPGVVNDDSAYMRFTLPNGDTSDVMVKDVRSSYSVKDGNVYYIFDCHVAAKDISGTIRAQMFTAEGEGNIYTFTVKSYARYLVENKDNDPEFAKAQGLAKALLNYGAYAREFFGAEGSITPDPEAISGVTIGDDYGFDPVGLYIDPDHGSFAGTSLSLKSKTTLSFYLETDCSVDYGITCEQSDDNDKTYECEVVTSGKYKIIRVYGIEAKDLGKKLDLYFSLDNEPCHIKGYSPMTYCYKVVNAEDGTYDAKLVNVCKALYRYWEEADKYSKLP